jgi:hypothetical protein
MKLKSPLRAGRGRPKQTGQFVIAIFRSSWER